MAADDLAAADAVGVGQHDVERLDLGMGVEKGFGLIDCGARRRSHGETLLSRRLSHDASSPAISPKAAISVTITREGEVTRSAE